MTERAQQLSVWLASVSYEDVRRAESAYPLRLPSGKLLRGVSLGQGFYLTREREILECWGGELHPVQTLDYVARRLAPQYDYIADGLQRLLTPKAGRRRRVVAPTLLDA